MRASLKIEKGEKTQKGIHTNILVQKRYVKKKAAWEHTYRSNVTGLTCIF
jgi:hypothetical protein